MILCARIKLYTEGETSVEEKGQVAETGSQEREKGRGRSWVSANHKRECPLGEILSGETNNCMKRPCGLFPGPTQLNNRSYKQLGGACLFLIQRNHHLVVKCESYIISMGTASLIPRLPSKEGKGSGHETKQETAGSLSSYCKQQTRFHSETCCV